MGIETEVRMDVNVPPVAPGNPLLRTINVPAETRSLSPKNQSIIEKHSSCPSHSRQGHCIGATLQPLPRVGLLLKHWGRVYPLLLSTLGTPRRAEMVQTALRLQAVYAKCHASAAYLGASAGSNEKTWDRTLAILKDHNLVDVMRLRRSNGDDSVNQVDLRRLWLMLERYIQHSVGLVEKLGRRFWVKAGGCWLDLRLVSVDPGANGAHSPPLAPGPQGISSRSA